MNQVIELLQDHPKFGKKGTKVPLFDVQKFNIKVFYWAKFLENNSLIKTNNDIILQKDIPSLGQKGSIVSKQSIVEYHNKLPLCDRVQLFINTLLNTNKIRLLPNNNYALNESLIELGLANTEVTYKQIGEYYNKLFPESKILDEFTLISNNIKELTSDFKSQLENWAAKKEQFDKLNIEMVCTTKQRKRYEETIENLKTNLKNNKKQQESLKDSDDEEHIKQLTNLQTNAENNLKEQSILKNKVDACLKERKIYDKTEKDMNESKSKAGDISVDISKRSKEQDNLKKNYKLNDRSKEETEYFNKYLKYKNKYLELKNKLKL